MENMYQFQITCRFLIKIYLQMTSFKSTRQQQKGPCQHAVHLLAVQFDRQYSRNYILYFQKAKSSSTDFQILGRYEIKPKMIPPKTPYYFQSPTAIQHFKVISEDNLEFKWSLYMEKNLDNYSHEQHMQSKKVNLRWCWQAYLNHQESIHRVEVLFGTVKINFYYLFVLGQTQESILDSINSHYKANNIYPIKYFDPYQINKDIQERQLINHSNLEFIPKLTYKISDTTPIMLQSQSLFHLNSQIEDSKAIADKLLLESLDFYDDKLLQSNKLRPKNTFNISEYPSLAFKDDQLMLKSTDSQLHFSKDIHKRIDDISFQASRFFQEKNFLHIQRKNNDRANNIINFNSLQNTRHITKSQYFNEKQNEMIVSPFYFSIKYWVIFISAIVIFLTLINLGPRAKKHQIKSSNQSKTFISQHDQHDRAEKIEKNKKMQKKKEKSKKKKTAYHQAKQDRTSKNKR